MRSSELDDDDRAGTCGFPLDETARTLASEVERGRVLTPASVSEATAVAAVAMMLEPSFMIWEETWDGASSTEEPPLPPTIVREEPGIRSDNEEARGSSSTHGHLLPVADPGMAATASG